MPYKKSFSPKIVIYGCGFVGQALTKLCVKKNWEIVAAYNRAGAKVGQDIGRLAGLDRDMGIFVQDSDTADYSSLKGKADIVLNATEDLPELNMPCYERFMPQGINVLCHGGPMQHPWWFNPEYAEKIDTLAKKHNVTFTAGGLWDMTTLWSGMISAGPCVEIESVFLRSNTELMRQGPRWEQKLGYGLQPEVWNKKIGREVNPVLRSWAVPMVNSLQTWGYEISDVSMYQEPVIWDEPAYCPHLNKHFPAGVAVGMRLVINVATTSGVTGTIEHEYRVFHEGEEEKKIWIVNGTPSFELHVVRKQSGIASASSLFNRIPDVIAARPGIVTLMEHGPLMPSVNL